MSPVGGNNVAMPPGNHPYALFAPDTPWEITYDGVLYLEQVLRCELRPLHPPQQDVLYERVLFLGVPNNVTDPRATLTYSVIWHHVAASLADRHHTSIEAKLERLRRWCRMAHDLNGFVGQVPYFEPITALLREQALAILACVSNMIPSSMRTQFCQHSEMHGIVAAEPLAFVLRFPV